MSYKDYAGNPYVAKIWNPVKKEWVAVHQKESNPYDLPEPDVSTPKFDFYVDAQKAAVAKQYQQQEQYKQMVTALQGGQQQQIGIALGPLQPQAKPTPFLKADISVPKNLWDLSVKAPDDSQGYTRLLLMGDSGTGKTRFIGTMPSPFMADFDRGEKTLNGQAVKGMSFGPDEWAEFKAELTKWRGNGGPLYDCETFALDSLTMACDAAMNWVLKKNGHAGQAPQIGEWGEAIREVKDVLGWITTLQCNVIVTAHNQLVKDEILGDIQNLPLAFGKDLPHRVGIYFDEVYGTTVIEQISGGKKAAQYRLQVKPDGRNKIIKSRMNKDGKLFDTYEAPDFAQLAAKAAGG